VSIIQTLTTSFKVGLYNGTHAFGTPPIRASATPDVFKIALYTSAASLDSTVTAYTSLNEVVGTGYTAGGLVLSNIVPASSGTAAYISFAPVTWNPAVFTSAGALIYNSSQSNAAVAVLAFGMNRTAFNTFVVSFPIAAAGTAVIGTT
jgi:hypothetical protein